MDLSLQPLIDDGPVIFWHAVCALAALALASWQLMGPKGTQAHRMLGWSWTALMVFVALSSFWIHDLRIVGPFSPIHLLSIITLVNLPLAVLAARRGQVARHRLFMRSLFITGLILPGLFTLIPGRTMHAVMFGG
ncbi:MAG: DUF2306 domain-containing protein [Pseudomonadota bacterium]